MIVELLGGRVLGDLRLGFAAPSEEPPALRFGPGTAALGAMRNGTDKAREMANDRQGAERSFRRSVWKWVVIEITGLVLEAGRERVGDLAVMCSK